MGKSAARCALLIAWLAGGGCHREEPPARAPDGAVARLGAIVPLVPAARVDAAVPDAHVAQAAASPLAVRVVLEPVTPFRDLDALARALEARATAFDAEAPRAVPRDGRVVLSFVLAERPFRGIVLDQLVRRGELALYEEDAGCDPFEGVALPAGMDHDWNPWLEPDGTTGSYVVEAPDPSRGAAPLAPLRALIASHRAPPGHEVLVGAVRLEGTRDVARRTYCVFERGAIRAPVVRDASATLDRTTLEPVLRIQLGPPDDRRLAALTLRALGRRIVVALDGDVVVSARVNTPVSDGHFQAVPQSPVPSTSPEVVAALLRSGPLPVDVRVVEQ